MPPSLVEDTAGGISHKALSLGLLRRGPRGHTQLMDFLGGGHDVTSFGGHRGFLRTFAKIEKILQLW